MIGVGMPGGGITPIGSIVRWVLNTDPANVLGITYQWDDTQLWDDVNNWKD